jgi:hypothetical protein
MAKHEYYSNYMGYLLTSFATGEPLPFRVAYAVGTTTPIARPFSTSAGAMTSKDIAAYTLLVEEERAITAITTKRCSECAI